MFQHVSACDKPEFDLAEHAWQDLGMTHLRFPKTFARDLNMDLNFPTAPGTRASICLLASQFEGTIKNSPLEVKNHKSSPHSALHYSSYQLNVLVQPLWRLWRPRAHSYAARHLAKKPEKIGHTSCCAGILSCTLVHIGPDTWPSQCPERHRITV